MGGYALRSAFDSKSGQLIMVGLLLMVGSFYLGTIFGNNAPIYVARTSSNSSSPGIFCFSCLYCLLAHAVEFTNTHFNFPSLFFFLFKKYLCGECKFAFGLVILELNLRKRSRVFFSSF